MKFLITYLLAPLSYLLFTMSATFYSGKFSGELRHKILAAYFFVACLLALKMVFQNTWNLEIYNSLCVITSVGLSCYFYLLMTTILHRRIVVVLAGVQVVYSIFSNFIFVDPTSFFDSMAYVILSTGMVVMIFLYVFDLLNNVNQDPLSMNFDFWFVASQLIYFLGSFLIFLSFDYLSRKIVNSPPYTGKYQLMYVWMWGVHNVLLFLSSLLTAASVLWIAFHKKSLSS